MNKNIKVEEQLASLFKLKKVLYEIAATNATILNCQKRADQWNIHDDPFTTKSEWIEVGRSHEEKRDNLTARYYEMLCRLTSDTYNELQPVQRALPEAFMTAAEREAL
jgi:hypothetical protein